MRFPAYLTHAVAAPPAYGTAALYKERARERVLTTLCTSSCRAFSTVCHGRGRGRDRAHALPRAFAPASRRQLAKLLLKTSQCGRCRCRCRCLRRRLCTVFHWCPNIGQQRAQWQRNAAGEGAGRRRRQCERSKKKKTLSMSMSMVLSVQWKRSWLPLSVLVNTHTHTLYTGVCVSCLLGCVCKHCKLLRWLPPQPQPHKNNLHNMSAQRVYAPLSSMREFMSGLVGIHKYFGAFVMDSESPSPSRCSCAQ